MNKTVCIILIAAAVLAAAAAAVLIPALKVRREQNAVRSALTEVTFTVGGGMEDSLYRLTLTVSDGMGGARAELVTREAHGMPEKRRRGKADAETVTELEKLIEKSGMLRWGKLPPAGIFALDAPSTSFSVTFADGSTVCVSDCDELPAGGWAAIYEVRDRVLSGAGLKK